MSGFYEQRIAGLRLIIRGDMKPDEILIIPDRRTLESDAEYWARCQSQAVLMRGIEVPPAAPGSQPASGAKEPRS